jgi:uncharacterized protein YjbI with pentapeptide repeats
VNLNQADLTNADLSGANLCGANLEGVKVQGTIFQNADLRGIPWPMIMELTWQPEVNWTGAQWDQPEDD